MTNSRRILIAVAACIFLPVRAGAVCIGPDDQSGYREPLRDEMRETRHIVIGKVLKVVPVFDDPDDPEGENAHLFTVRVQRRLRGATPDVLVVRVENDSGRYLMEVGERHLLFLAPEGDHYTVNSCGNSTPLPEGARTLARVEARLRPAAAPSGAPPPSRTDSPRP